MACSPRDRDRRRLEQEIQAGGYHELLLRLQVNGSFFRGFRCWADVIAFMRSGTSTDPRKDEVLRPIFQAHAEDGDPRWRAILLAIFWPGLASIHVRKEHWDDDPDERWGTIVWVFLRLLSRVDVARRPNRLVQKVYNDTIHHAYDEYWRTWKRSKRELATDPDELEELVGGEDGINTASIELAEVQRLEMERLQRHLDAGRINDTDFLLLTGTRVYGRSLADYARGVGLDYQIAKKRRQRAEARIRRFEEKKA